MTDEQGILTDFMKKEIGKTKRALAFTLIVGIIVFLVVVWYFGKLYVEFQKKIQPGPIAEVVINQISGKIPGAGKGIEAALIKGAPEIASGLSKRANAAVPIIAKRISEQLNTLLDRGLNSFENEVKQSLGAAIQKDMPYIKDALGKIDDEEVAKRIAYDLAKSSEASVGTLIPALQELNDELKKLAVGSNLTEDEKDQRETLIAWLKYLDSPK